MTDYQRNTNERASGSDDFDYFITTELPLQQIQDMLILQKKSNKEIEEILEKVKETRERIRKQVRKFVEKIEKHYGHTDIPELIKKGLKHAQKHKLTQAQQKVFINHILKGDVSESEYSFVETKQSPMAKFLGYAERKQSSQMLRIEPKDQAKLNELKMMYDQTLVLHSDVKNNVFNYEDCAPQAMNGIFDRTKHDVHVHVHPVLAMLFLPKVEYIEKRMLLTNIARMVLSRGQAYLRGASFHLQTGVTPMELDAEFELAHDIAYDPNSLEQFTDQTPITNIVKRYRCQVELYKSVLRLRNGLYYSTGYGVDDGISGFLRVINEQDWTFFDSPDLYHAQDEGTILRKLLAVFSIRPTFTQLSSVTQRSGAMISNVTNISKIKLMQIPIVNLKLPLDAVGEGKGPDFHLRNALSQTDNFIENGTIVPKSKSIIYSNQVCFFYANRRYQANVFTAIDATLNMRYNAIPTPVMNTTRTNTTNVVFDDTLIIGRDRFELRSICVLQRPPLNGLDVPTGVAALVRHKDQNNGETSHYYYNPSGAAVQYLDTTIEASQGKSQYRSNDPISYVYEYDRTPNGVGFRDEGQCRGTIYFYSKI